MLDITSDKAVTPSDFGFYMAVSGVHVAQDWWGANLGCAVDVWLLTLVRAPPAMRPLSGLSWQIEDQEVEVGRWSPAG